MINFFRRIRYNLMEQNKTGKYLKYAIGEILLVVIGILIALQVNNWNEERKIQRTELKVLNDLKEEFVFNKDRFDKRNIYKTKLKATWKQFLNDISDTSNIEKVAVRRPGNGSEPAHITNSALTSFLSTGKIENISNELLKYKLINWENIVSNYNELQNRHKSFVETELRKFEFAKRVLPTLQMRNENFKNPFYKMYSERKINDMFLELNTSIEYQNMLINNYMWINNTVQVGVELEKSFDEIINLLNDEISKR